MSRLASSPYLRRAASAALTSTSPTLTLTTGLLLLLRPPRHVVTYGVEQFRLALGQCRRRYPCLHGDRRDKPGCRPVPLMAGYVGSLPPASTSLIVSSHASNSSAWPPVFNVASESARHASQYRSSTYKLSPENAEPRPFFRAFSNAICCFGPAVTMSRVPSSLMMVRLI